MNVQLVQSSADFAQLRSGWNELLSRSSSDTIFLTWEWLWSWWESYACPNDALHIITVRDGADELIGILPFYKQIRPWLPLAPVTALRFIGDGSWDSDYLDVILLKGREHEIIDSVWQWLGSTQRSWNLLELAGVPEN